LIEAPWRPRPPWTALGTLGPVERVAQFRGDPRHERLAQEVVPARHDADLQAALRQALPAQVAVVRPRERLGLGPDQSPPTGIGTGHVPPEGAKTRGEVLAIPG